MVMFAFIYSEKDIASKTLFEEFKVIAKDYPHIPHLFYEYDEEVIYADKVDRKLPNEVTTIIFLSRHSASSNIPTLSVHTPGNFNDNPYGGRKKELAPANPCLVGNILREYIRKIKELGINYEATLEVTHHGPTDLKKPSVFVEIGPNESQWLDKVGARCIAISVFNAIDLLLKSKGCIKCVGFGGPHYAPNFTRYAINNDNVGIGHIVSKYVLKEFDEKPVEMALNMNGGVDRVLISWKGLKGGVRQALYSYLKNKGLEIVKL